MKKLILLLLVCLISFSGFAQEWRKAENTDSYVYKDDYISLTVTESMFKLGTGAKMIRNIILYDSFGHFLYQYKNVYYCENKRQGLYKTLYKFVSSVNGWIRIDGHDIPTVRQLELDKERVREQQERDPDILEGK